MTKDDTPAFPVPDISTGMTLRDYIATASLAGLLRDNGYYTAADVAKDAYAVADAMMKARQG